MKSPIFGKSANSSWNKAWKSQLGGYQAAAVVAVVSGLFLIFAAFMPWHINVYWIGMVVYIFSVCFLMIPSIQGKQSRWVMALLFLLMAAVVMFAVYMRWDMFRNVNFAPV